MDDKDLIEEINSLSIEQLANLIVIMKEEK
jgi:hypothetical protein